MGLWAGIRFEAMLQLLLLPIAVVLGAEQFAPETIFIPYSETEDVDFTIERPGRVGCYQWSCDNEEVIELAPVQNDYRDFRLVATVKDSEGRTLDNTTSASPSPTPRWPFWATQQSRFPPLWWQEYLCRADQASWFIQMERLAI